MMKKTRRYSTVATMETFEERFNYLKLDGNIGNETFGYDRYLNQNFYKSKEWQDIRNKIIIRDNACDLGVPGHEIYGNIYIHHINPITIDNIKNFDEYLLDPDNLICTSFETHNAIHYGDNSIVNKNKIVDRKQNDTIPWKKGSD